MAIKARTYTKKQIGFYLSKAKKYKDDIRPIYENILNLTDPFKTMNDAGKTLFDTQRNIDSDVIDAIEDSANFTMKGLMPRGEKWADLKVDERAFKAEQGSDTLAQRTLMELQTNLSKDTDATFSYIEASNQYVEVSKAVKDLETLGTGCYRTNETPSASKPISYNYVSLDNLYILEDAQSRPNFVFKYHYEVNGEYLYDMFGADIQLKGDLSDDDPEAETTVIEIVLPSYDETNAITTYKYLIMDESLENTYLEKEMLYNPFVVFRSGVLQGNPWGISKVATLVDTLEDIKTYRELLEKQARRIADPPTVYYGDKQLLNHLDNRNGAINYAGNPNEGGSPARFETLGGEGSLMPLDSILNDLRTRFRSAMMSNPLGNVEEVQNRTATEMSLRHQLFRDKNTNKYELLSTELLEPTFKNPFIILLERGLLETKKEVLSVMSVNYENEITRLAEQAKIQSYLQYSQYVSQIQQAEQFGVSLNIPYVIADIGKIMRIPVDAIPDEAQLREIEEAKKQAQAQQQVQAQLQ